MSIKPSRLESPAQKLYIGQLLNCVQSEGDERINQWKWRYTINTTDFCLVFNQVWVQGFVTVTMNKSDIVIDDGTGIVLLTGIDKIYKEKSFNKGKPCSSSFKLLMTITVC